MGWRESLCILLTDKWSDFYRITYEWKRVRKRECEEKEEERREAKEEARKKTRANVLYETLQLL